jgi:hypothetical protein
MSGRLPIPRQFDHDDDYDNDNDRDNDGDGDGCSGFGVDNHLFFALSRNLASPCC